MNTYAIFIIITVPKKNEANIIVNVIAAQGLNIMNANAHAAAIIIPTNTIARIISNQSGIRKPIPQLG